MMRMCSGEDSELSGMKGLPDGCHLHSSANKYQIYRQMEFTKLPSARRMMVKRRWPRTEPWGTPEVMHFNWMN